MHTLLNYTDSTINRTKNDSGHIVFSHSSSSSSLDNLSNILLIFILSILCILGVIFMMFGPMMRSEAWKHIDNYIFGEDKEHESQDDGGGGGADGGDA
jgi:hypothetical protein